MKTYLGLELGSTRIKAAAVDEEFHVASSGGYTWKSSFSGGVWTYDLDEAWRGVRAALEGIENRESVCCMGVSGMMHGYLAFDRNWNLLVPFRTWQNTMTGEAADELTRLFGFNVPQRWSIAHLYQAILNREDHVADIAHITTLAGYVHYCLTGENVLGVGEASGMFPIDEKTLDYDEEMLEKFAHLVDEYDFSWDVRDVLPRVLSAGECAGRLTAKGAERLGGLLLEGIVFAPPEGDAGTGMVATNAVAPRTGNVSAGTSIFSMVVLERPLRRVYPEIDIVATPAGKPVAMVHCNNGTNDMNAWIALLKETVEMFGGSVDTGEIFTKLYQKSLEGEADCGGVMVYNYLAGEGVTHLDEGRAMVVRDASANLTLANFMRAQLFSTMTTLRLGMDLLKEEHVAVDSLTGHGGLFKTPFVGQKFLAAACGAPVTCMEAAGEGGPYGMALLCAYQAEKQAGQALEDFLNERVFRENRGVTVAPDAADVAGFLNYTERFASGLAAERMATETL